ARRSGLPRPLASGSAASPCRGIQPTMTADPQSTKIEPNPDLTRRIRSERLLATLAPFARVVVVSHVNPDPDSLGSMLGIKALVEATQPGKPVILTVDGIVARSENRAMVDLLRIPLVPVAAANPDAATAVVMVDTQ